nr:MAG TPA: hypothetical protein [Caudoviricetes sp.]
MTNPVQSAILVLWSEEVHFHLPQSGGRYAAHPL